MLGRFLKTRGFTGECPDWYAIMQAARYLGVAPWDLIEQPTFWLDKALVAMEVEGDAQKNDHLTEKYFS